MQNFNSLILAIESSCDDTSCAILNNETVLSNITATQKIHAQYGGVVPELASRDHEKNIIPVVDAALKAAGVALNQLTAVAVTRGPGLVGSLLVGLSFAKSLSLALKIPLIEVNHMQAHILSNFILKKDNTEKKQPEFPFVCLTVSGGHTQLVKVNSHLEFELLGQTIDDAVGEAFDKAAKMLGLPYPGGPLIDKLAQGGNKTKFIFATPKIAGYDYSFSGIKTSFLYFIRDQVKLNENFIAENLNDICASYQTHLVKVLLINARRLLKETGIRHFALAGGVSANSALREQVQALENELVITTYIPEFEFCTDNAAMIGIAAHYKALQSDFSHLGLTPLARMAV
jgi:N6-L-threonylcarbamoyladenine synthase